MELSTSHAQYPPCTTDEDPEVRTFPESKPISFFCSFNILGSENCNVNAKPMHLSKIQTASNMYYSCNSNEYLQNVKSQSKTKISLNFYRNEQSVPTERSLDSIIILWDSVDDGGQYVFRNASYISIQSVNIDLIEENAAKHNVRVFVYVEKEDIIFVTSEDCNLLLETPRGRPAENTESLERRLSLSDLNTGYCSLQSEAKSALCRSISRIDVPGNANGFIEYPTPIEIERNVRLNSENTNGYLRKNDGKNLLAAVINLLIYLFVISKLPFRLFEKMFSWMFSSSTIHQKFVEYCVSSKKLRIPSLVSVFYQFREPGALKYLLECLYAWIFLTKNKRANHESDTSLRTRKYSTNKSPKSCGMQNSNTFNRKIKPAPFCNAEYSLIDGRSKKGTSTVYVRRMAAIRINFTPASTNCKDRYIGSLDCVHGNRNKALICTNLTLSNNIRLSLKTILHPATTSLKFLPTIMPSTKESDWNFMNIIMKFGVVYYIIQKLGLVLYCCSDLNSNAFNYFAQPATKGIWKRRYVFWNLYYKISKNIKSMKAICSKLIKIERKVKTIFSISIARFVNESILLEQVVRKNVLNRKLLYKSVDQSASSVLSIFVHHTFRKLGRNDVKRTWYNSSDNMNIDYSRVHDDETTVPNTSEPVHRKLTAYSKQPAHLSKSRKPFRLSTRLVFMSVAFIVLIQPSFSEAGSPDAKRLYDDLLSNYNKLVRPVMNVTNVLTVRIKLKLSQLIDVVSNNFDTSLFTISMLHFHIVCIG